MFVSPANRTRELSSGNEVLTSGNPSSGRRIDSTRATDDPLRKCRNEVPTGGDTPRATPRWSGSSWSSSWSPLLSSSFAGCGDGEMSVLASGSVTDRPWGMTIGALGPRGLTGEPTLAADGQQYRIALVAGAIVGPYSPPGNGTAARLPVPRKPIPSVQ